MTLIVPIGKKASADSKVIYYNDVLRTDFEKDNSKETWNGVKFDMVNPLMPFGISHLYQLGEPISNLRVVG